MEQTLQTLRTARSQGLQAGLTAGDVPADRAAAYDLAMAQIDQPVAWKIGGANAWSRAAFSINHIFFGPLTEAELSIGTTKVSLAGLVAPLAEPEIMVRIADPEANGLDGFLDDFGFGVEIPATVLPVDLKPQLHAQIVDRAGAGGLWVVPGAGINARYLTEDLTGSFRHNDAPEIVWRSSDLSGSVADILREFRALTRQYGIVLLPGQWIATGGVCKAVSVVPGDSLSIGLPTGQLQLQFTV